MVENVVQFYTGYIQIHAKGYWDDQKINNSFVASDSLKRAVENNDYTQFVIPRLESFALGSAESQTKGVAVIGTIPEKETQLTGIRDKIIKGAYLSSNDEGVVIAEKLAEYLKLSVNDTLVMISQGFHGVSAAGKYPVRGIVKFKSPELNRRTVFMTLQNCQDFYSAYGRITSLVLVLDNPNRLEEVQTSLTKQLDTAKYEVMTWDEMLPELVQQIKADNASGIILLAILYIIITFGIFGTVMMMVAERRKEFAIMIAVGMQRYKLAFVVFLESLFITLLGLISGVIASIPVLLYFLKNPIHFSGETAQMMIDFGIEPIMKVALEGSFYIGQAITVFILAIIAVIWPLISIIRTNISKTIKN